VWLEYLLSGEIFRGLGIIRRSFYYHEVYYIKKKRIEKRR